MNKWSKIKSRICQDKLDEVNGLFAEIHSNINNTKVPRYKWVTPLENWTTSQIKKNNSLKLSLQEFAYLKKMVEDLNDSFAQNIGTEEQLINETQEIFINDYNKILELKDNDLKLEISAELIEEKQFPLEIFIEWYKLAHTLPPEKFNEELGDFWGDVWKHAAGGAGYGGLAGTAVGGLPGTFAGAGLGGLAGGLYGGASNLLKRVWQYRQTQRNFEQTKQKAVEALKKLKELSQGFDMHPNFINSLDSMIDQLGTARAYRVANANRPQPTDQGAIPGQPVNPMKQPHPGWAELGKYSSTAPTGPTSTTTAPPVTAPTAPTAPPVTSAPPLPTTGKRRQNISDEEREARRQRMNQRWAKQRAAQEEERQRAAQEEKERQALLAAGKGANPPTEPTTAPVETEKEEGIRNEQDLVDLYNKVKDDPKQLAKVGISLMTLGMHKPVKGKMTIRDNIPLDAKNFNHYYNHLRDKEDYNPPEDEAADAIQVANLYIKSLSEKKEAEALTTPGVPKETTPVAGEEPVQRKLKSDEELMNMTKKDLEKYIEDFGYGYLLKKGVIENVGEPDQINRRSQAVNLLRINVEHPKFAEPKESAFTKIRKMLQESSPLQSKLEVLPITDKIAYIKALLKS